MATAAAIRRRRSANNARIAAKQRRQKILVVVLAAVLAVLLAYEVPHLLERSSGDSSAAVPAAPAASGPKTMSTSGGGNGADPFAIKSLSDGDAHALSAGGPDPFTRSSLSSSGSASSSASASSSTSARLEPIVLGQPGGHRIATRGWIVILASIPNADGRPAALSFAHEARRAVGEVSVLNSSNRRPLRGGYWVVYTGPYATLAQVSRRADDIHTAGYGTAYIRELISYR